MLDLFEHHLRVREHNVVGVRDPVRHFAIYEVEQLLRGLPAHSPLTLGFRLEYLTQQGPSRGLDELLQCGLPFPQVRCLLVGAGVERPRGLLLVGH